MSKVAEILLSLKGVTAGYDGRPILQCLNLDILRGRTLLVIGPNGAGKSTLLRTIMGFIRQTSGTLHYRNILLDCLPPHARVHLGISYVFQDRRVFPTLTVEENLKVATRGTDLQSMLAAIFQRYPILAEKRKTSGGLLSGGEQQLLAIGRALVQRPEVILFDEPTNGLSPRYVVIVLDEIRRLSSEGITCVLVEHRVRDALECADEVIGIRSGGVVFKGDTTDIGGKTDGLADILVDGGHRGW